MTHEQYTKAEGIVARKTKLTKQLNSVDSDLKKIRDNYSNTEYDLHGTSLTLYRDDVLIILGTKHAWLTAEIKFLEHQLSII